LDHIDAGMLTTYTITGTGPANPTAGGTGHPH
jgi:hypothetical protein